MQSLQRQRHRFDHAEHRSLLPLSDPPIGRWVEHFDLEGVAILPITDTGTNTMGIRDLNPPDRILERWLIHFLGRCPLAASGSH